MGSLFLARKSPEQIEAEKRQIRLREWYSNRALAAPLAARESSVGALTTSVTTAGSETKSVSATGMETMPATRAEVAASAEALSATPLATGSTPAAAGALSDSTATAAAASPSVAAPTPSNSDADDRERFQAAMRAAADAIARLPQGAEWAEGLVAEWKRLESASATPTTGIADAAAELAVDAIWMANQLEAQSAAMQRLREHFERKDGYRLRILEGGRLAVRSDELGDFTMVWGTTIGDDGLSVEADVFAVDSKAGTRTAQAPPEDVQETIHRVQTEAVTSLAQVGVETPKGPCSFGPHVPVLDDEASPEKQGEGERASRRAGEGGCHIA